MQNNNDQIIEIAVQAQAAGYSSYGKYVAAVDPPRAPTKKREYPICTKCGAEITNCGKGHRKLCDKCRHEAASEGAKKAAENKKEYHRKCTRCGAEVITKQMPSQSRGGKIYCSACRVEVNKIYMREWRLRQKGKRA